MSTTLAPVDEALLSRLVQVARTDTDPDEVTPPLGVGWSEERIAWFEEYHRRCRDGLRADGGEQTWAVLHDGDPVGAVRLQRAQEPDVLVTGIWLARSARGRGLARQATTLVLAEARRAGAVAVVADTAAVNQPAQALLRAHGFVLSPDGGRVQARLDVRAPDLGTPDRTPRPDPPGLPVDPTVGA